MRPPAGWVLGRMLAIGGTAVVYEIAGGAPAVLKWARWAHRDIRGRFVIEAEVLRTVGPPSTPALIDHGAVDDSPYLIMERVSGETLASWMARNGERGGLGEIAALLTRITTVLGVLHDAGYVHRDLKPENLCIGPRGVRLLDFGLAKSVRGSATSSLTQAGVAVGTPHYMAPEQIRTGGAVDHRADIYSLGVIMFEMLAGHPPFVGDRRAIEYQHQVSRPPSVRETRAIPRELDELVARCLSKQPDSRPQSTTELREALAKALDSAGTLRGIGGVTPSSPMKPLGVQSEVALAWIAGGDPVAVARAITAVQGIVVKQRGEGLLAAFTATQHDDALTTALAVCRELPRERCRVVVHTTSALVRRTSQGKLMVYGTELERTDAWTPAVPFVGLLLTARATEHTKSGIPAPDLPGYFRERELGGHTTDCRAPVSFVGRGRLVAAIANAVARPVVVSVSGEAGAGKTRLLEELLPALRASGRDVIHVRARRRFAGDHADDERVARALESQNAIVLVDDVDRLSRAVLQRLLDARRIARIVTSAAPLFEVAAGDTDRVAIELPPLSHAEAGAMLREQLRPARLIPDVLIERLALRGAGNPRLLLALARDVKQRGAVRRNPGSDEWYVAADELDTLLAPPGPSWLAMRALDELPVELVPIARACAGLGPRFNAGELAHVTGVANVDERLAFLIRDGMIVERNGWYELDDAALQVAIYEHVLDDRDAIHSRALAYWLAQPSVNTVGRLARIAYHAAGSGDHDTAAACWLALARIARRRGESDHADALDAAAAASLSTKLSTSVRELVDSIDE